MQLITQVAGRPPKPLMVYNGECEFCKFWIRRWRAATGGKVDYIASQDPQVRREYPEIPPAQFEHSVQLIATDGRVYSGAESVLRALADGDYAPGLLWAYQHLPGAKFVAEGSYRVVANHRGVFSKATRWFFGKT